MAYQYLKEDNSAYHMQHPDGSSFRIAKKGLSKATHEKIQSMKPLKMADGGEVDESEIPEALQTPADYTANQMTPKFDQVASEAPQMPAQAPQVETPSWLDFDSSNPSGMLPQQNVPQGAIPEPVSVSDQNAANQEQALKSVQGSPQAQAPQAQVPGSPMGAMQAYDQALNQMGKGTQDIANAQSKLAQDQAKAFEAAQTEMQAKDLERQDLMKGYAEENNQLMKAMQEQKIDPAHFMSTRTAAQKIFIGLGMALSAAGGNGEAAANMVNRAIDRDIDAQRIELGKKQNLLSINMQKTRDLNSAYALTKAQMLTTLELKTKQMAVSAGSPIAQANAQTALAKIGIMKAQLYMQAALNQQKAQSLGFGTQGGVPVGQESFALLSDPKYTERRVLVNGRAFQHVADGKAANELRVFESKMDPITTAVNRLTKLGRAALVPGTAAHEEAESLRAGLATSIAGLKSTEIGSSRINGEEANQALDQIKNPSSWKQIINGDIRNNTFLKDLAETRESVRSQNLIGYKPLPEAQSLGGVRRGGGK